MSESALTPDFYRYEWQPLETVSIEDRFVHLGWPDGVRLLAFDLWLYENGVGSGGVDTQTREALIDPAHLDMALRVVNAEISIDGSLSITFNDGVSASYHPGWLRHVADNEHLSSAWLPAEQIWTSSTLPEPPTHDATHVLDDPTVLPAFMNDLLAYGIARLRHLSTDLDDVLTMMRPVGPLRNTNFGATWDVKAIVEQHGDAETNSTANTTLRLGPHTDLPTRETPPGFQFLQCLVNDTTGGFSTMADGAAVVAAFQVEHPDHYETLTTLRWVFFNRGEGIDHRWSGPMIDLGQPGDPLTLRAFYPVRGFPDMPPEDMPRAYAAMHAFAAMADDPAFRMSYPFEPGDLVAFDNRRVLHGRDAFESGGARHLRGFYIDRDEILSYTRVQNRARRANPTPGQEMFHA